MNSTTICAEEETALKTRFENDGFLRVPALFSLPEVAALKERVARLVSTESVHTGVQVWFPDELDALVGEAVLGPRVGELLRPLLGPRPEFLSVKPVYKSARVSFASPWHQDRAYWGGSVKLSFWIALDPCTEENGCLKVIPGSHRQFLEHGKYELGKFENRIREELLADQPVLSVEMQPGDALIFHDLLVHGSHPNRSGRDRWSLIPTYRDGATPDASKVWKQGGVPLRG